MLTNETKHLIIGQHCIVPPEHPGELRQLATILESDDRNIWVRIVESGILRWYDLDNIEVIPLC